MWTLGAGNWTWSCNNSVDQLVVCCSGTTKKSLPFLIGTDGSFMLLPQHIFNSFELIRCSGLRTPPVFVNCSELFDVSTEVQERVVAKVELSVLFLGSFRWAVRYGLVKIILSTRFIGDWNNQKVLMKAPNSMITDRIGFGIIELIDRTKFDSYVEFLPWYVCARSTGMIRARTTGFPTTSNWKAVWRWFVGSDGSQTD